MNAEYAGIGKAPVEGIDGITEAAMLAHLLEQPRGHAAAENIGQDLRTIEIAHMIGLALEAEQDLRIPQVARSAPIATDIAGGLHTRRGARRLRRACQDLLHLLSKS